MTTDKNEVMKMSKYTDKNTSAFLPYEKARRGMNDVSKKYLDRFSKDIDSGRFTLESVKSCVCCGKEDFLTVSTIDRFKLKFGNILCQSCGLLSTSPRLREADLPDYYSEYYHPLTFGEEKIGNQKHLFSNGQGEKIFNLLDPYIEKNNIKLLEIGSGVGDVITGFISADKKREYELAIGVEFSDECIDVSVNLAKEMNVNVKFTKGGLLEAKEICDAYDVIILSHVFEHMVDLNQSLDILSNMLSEDGLLYIEVPGLFVNHMIPYYHYSFIDYTIHAHMYNFCAQTLQNIVSTHNLECLSINEKVEAIFKASSFENKKEIVDVSSQSLFYLNLVGRKEYLDFHQERDQQIVSLHEHIDQKNSNYDVINSRLDKKESDYGKLSDEFDHKSKICEELNEKLEYIKNIEIKSLEENLAEEKNRNNQLEKSVERGQLEVEDLKSKLSSLNLEADALNTIIQSLKSENKEVKNRLGALLAAVNLVSSVSIYSSFLKKIKYYKSLVKLTKDDK